MKVLEIALIRLRARGLVGALCLAIAPAGLVAQNNAIVLDPAPLIGYSLDWLAPGGQATSLPSEIVVYSLGCGKCIEELSAISQGFAPAPAQFILTTFQKKDRDVTLPLLQFGFAHSDPKNRRSDLLDMLRIYTEDPDHYRNNPSDWETVVASHWRGGISDADRGIADAFALNIMDMQTRILALMDKLGTPNAISLSQPALAPATERNSDRYKALVASLSLAWLRPPLEDAEDAGEILRRARSIDPLRSLNAEGWTELKAWALNGAYWIWGGRLSPNELTNIIDWQAQYHLLPDDESRKDRQRQWFDKTIERAKIGPLSPLEAFGFTDIDALASPAWGAAQADVQQQLVYGSYLGSLTIQESE
jgi:hypothetical protein